MRIILKKIKQLTNPFCSLKDRLVILILPTSIFKGKDVRGLTLFRNFILLISLTAYIKLLYSFVLMFDLVHGR